MGIRFYCPNGHKLNVKEFQAGRTGICPFCGAKMQIPLKSTRSSSKQERQHQGGASTAAPVAAGEKFSTTGQENPTVEGKAPAPAASDAAVDPLFEGGQSVWYVRPSSGGQFGPAAPDVMRIWLDEGRIAADSLVWREGWRDWQVADEVFPQLLQGPAIPGMEIVLSEPAASPISPIKASPVARRRSVRNAQLAVIGTLVFAVIVLFAILLVVLKQ